jgi:hypothetical protein
MDKPYRLPDPQKEPQSFLVIVYKTLKRIPFNDREWDRLYFPRCMKRTGQLLEILQNDLTLATQCMRELKDRFESDGISWTIETIIQYSFEWRSEHQRRNDRDCLRDLVSAYADKNIKEIIQPVELQAPQVREPDPQISEEERKQAVNVFGEAKKKLKQAAQRMGIGGPNGDTGNAKG